MKSLVFLSIPLTFNLSSSYLHLFFIKKSFSNRKRLNYLVLIVLLIGLISSLRLYVEETILFGIYSRDYYQHYTLGRVLYAVWETALFTYFIDMLDSTFENFRLKQDKSRILAEKAEFELKFLKAQLNPHFLFNTFQNLNYLIQTNIDQASSLVINFSNYLRFHFYEVNKKKVPLNKELKFLSDYIDIEEIRTQNRILILKKIDHRTTSQEITPLVLINFVENAFKHGNPVYSKGKILIKIKHSNTGLDLFIANIKGESKQSSFVSGLNRATKILEYDYPQKHALKIRNGYSYYAVKLELKL